MTRVRSPHWGCLPTLVAALVCALVAPAAAGRRAKKTPAPLRGSGGAAGGGAAPASKDQKLEPDGPTRSTAADTDKPNTSAPSTPASTPGSTTPAKPSKPPKEQNINLEGLGFNGKNRSPQLLYFLERANEELERASLEKRSFIPHIVRSMEDDAL
jgi:hypothetical protein